MPVSDAKKLSSRKWDKKNMTTVGCRITREKADLFKLSCLKLGTCPNAVFIKAVEATIKSASEK